MTKEKGKQIMVQEFHRLKYFNTSTNQKYGLKRFISLLLLVIIIIQPTFQSVQAKTTGESKLRSQSAVEELNAVWISYLEFNDRLKDPTTGKLGFTRERFEAVIDEMFDQVVNLKMNAVIVHVRPFGDAMYPSEYFPWSKYISGEQGKDPGFDPLDYMITAAHDRGLQFHAWLNPYRVTNNTVDVKTLSKDNMARKWRTNKNTKDDRRVLTYGNALYYNPSDVNVQSLIRDGINEIVENYEVDGIHFDDYFYPTLGTNYKKNFDYKEYQEYYAWCKENKVKVKSIADWRRNNVNRLVKKVYKEIKAINDSVQFGISPAGYYDVLMMDDRYYCDIATWLSEPGYIDYICPQLYWTFSHAKYPFDKTLDQWLSFRSNTEVKVYIGIPTYRAGSNIEADWYHDSDVLKNMIEYSRGTGLVDGFMYFRYDFFFNIETQDGVEALLEIL